MKRTKMENVLADTTEKDLPYVFIPSYNRPDFVTGSRLLHMFTDKADRKSVV